MIRGDNGDGEDYTFETLDEWREVMEARPGHLCNTLRQNMTGKVEFRGGEVEEWIFTDD
jgi:hypothetical protein